MGINVFVLVLLEYLDLDILPEFTQYNGNIFCMNKVLAMLYGGTFLYIHFLEETANVELESFSVSYKKNRSKQ